MCRVARFIGVFILFVPFASGDDLVPTLNQRASCIGGRCELLSPAVKRSGVKPSVRDSRSVLSRVRSSARLVPSRRLFLRRPLRLLRQRRSVIRRRLRSRLLRRSLLR